MLQLVRKWAAVVLVLQLVGPTRAVIGQVGRGSVVITHVRVFTGTEVVPSATVVIRDGIIAAFGRRATAPYDAIEIDGHGLTLLPGLIDSRVRLTPGALETAAQFGVTTEIDFGASPDLVARLRQQSREPHGTPVADFISGGIPLSLASSYPGYQLSITASDQVEAAVDSSITSGAAFTIVVVENALDRDEGLNGALSILKPLVSVTHRRHRMIVADTRSLHGAREAFSVGVDGLGQMFITQPTDPGFGGHVGQRQAFVISSLSELQTLAGRVGGDSLLSDSALGPYIATEVRQQILLRPAETNPSLPYEGASAALRLIPGRGGSILAGSGAGMPGVAHGVGLHRELQLLVAAGLTPVQALTAATSAPARVFCLKDKGRIRLGAPADLVLVRGDPTSDILATREIVRVWRAGVQVNRNPPTGDR